MDSKKEHIMDLAKARFEKFGFKKTTMREIIKDAGISATTLYEYFANKEDLFDAIFIREMMRSKESALRSVEKSQIDDPIERARIVGKAVAQYLKKDPFIQRVLSFENDLYSPFQKQKYKEMVERTFSERIAGYVSQGIKEKRYRECDADLAGYLLFKMFEAIIYRIGNGERGTRKGIDKDVEAMMDIFFKGIMV